jgi:hypothetical protein
MERPITLASLKPKIRLVGTSLVLIVCCLGVTKAYATVSLPTPIPLPTTAQSNCGSTGSKTVESPNKAWEAVIHEDYCDSPNLTTWALWTVTLIEISNPAQQSDVYALDDDGHANSEPVVKWTSNDALRITTLKDPFSTQAASSFAGITISYVYIKP